MAAEEVGSRPARSLWPPFREEAEQEAVGGGRGRRAGAPFPSPPFKSMSALTLPGPSLKLYSKSVLSHSLILDLGCEFA